MKKSLRLIAAIFVFSASQLTMASPETYHQALERAQREAPLKKEKCEAFHNSYVALLKDKEGPRSVFKTQKQIDEALKLLKGTKKQDFDSSMMESFFELKDPTKDDINGYFDLMDATCSIQKFNAWRAIINTSVATKADAKLKAKIVSAFQDWSREKNRTLLEVGLDFTIVKFFFENSLVAESQAQKSEVGEIAKDDKALQISIQADMTKEFIPPHTKLDAEDEKAVKEWKEATKFDPKKIQAIFKTEYDGTQKLDARVKALLEKK